MWVYDKPVDSGYSSSDVISLIKTHKLSFAEKHDVTGHASSS